jgi:hypothetical protein
MAKKPAAKPAKPPRVKKPPLLDTAELAGDAANPRKISDKAAGGLANSLDRFGDLSGIVWNKRTGELVCGHQRMQQIRAKWGDRPIEAVDAAHSLFGIRIDAAHFFPVRVVDWSKAMQRAANVAANSQKIAGEYTDDVSAYILEVQAALEAEAPGTLADTLLLELLELEAAAAEGEGGGAGGGKESVIAESYQVIVQCTDEAHQKRVYDQLTAEGLACKVLTL